MSSKQNPHTFVLALVLSAGVFGCGEDEPDPCLGVDPALETPTIELGTGFRSFQEITDTVPAYLGVQGSYHTFTSIRTTGFYPGPEDEIDRVYHGAVNKLDQKRKLLNPIIRYEVLRPQGELITSRELQEPLEPMGDTAADRTGDIVGFASNDGVAELEGVPARLSVSITDLCGREAKREITGLEIHIQEGDGLGGD